MLTVTIVVSTAKVSVQGPFARWFETLELSQLNKASTPTKRPTRVRAKRNMFSSSWTPRKKLDKSNIQSSSLNTVSSAVGKMDSTLGELNINICNILAPIVEANAALTKEVQDLREEVTNLQSLVLDMKTQVNNSSKERENSLKQHLTLELESTLATQAKKTDSMVQAKFDKLISTFSQLKKEVNDSAQKQVDANIITPLQSKQGCSDPRELISPQKSHDRPVNEKSQRPFFSAQQKEDQVFESGSFPNQIKP